eukprot:635428-Rhodomonas_salina.1
MEGDRQAGRQAPMSDTAPLLSSQVLPSNCFPIATPSPCSNVNRTHLPPPFSNGARVFATSATFIQHRFAERSSQHKQKFLLTLTPPQFFAECLEGGPGRRRGGAACAGRGAPRPARSTPEQRAPSPVPRPPACNQERE